MNKRAQMEAAWSQRLQAQANKYNALFKDVLQPGAQIVGRNYCGRFIVRVKAKSRPIQA